MIRAKNRSKLTVGIILEWADRHYQVTGSWPKVLSGPVMGEPGEVWIRIHTALYEGCRGLKGGQSLAGLLSSERGARNKSYLPRLTIKGILAMADRYHKTLGRWPRSEDGPIDNCPGETWNTVNDALRRGKRGLAAGNSLAKVLATHRGKRSPHNMPQLSEAQVIAWAKAHFSRWGRWPTAGMRTPVAIGAQETWSGLNLALRRGFRGLPGGTSLALVLDRCRNGRS